jgi:hypothetical protein
MDIEWLGSSNENLAEIESELGGENGVKNSEGKWKSGGSCNY